MLGNKIKILTITLLTLLNTVTLSAAKTVSYDSKVCGDAAYLFGCTVYSTSGNYSQTLGDSTVHLHLLFGMPTHVKYETSITAGQSYLLGCQTFTPTADTEQDVDFATVVGCDSTVTVKLKVKAPVQPVQVEYSTTIEQGQAYLFGCEILEATGSKSQTLGDSTVTVHLTVNVPEPVNVEYSTTIEQGQAYLFGCDILEATGSKSQTLGDSTVTVHLTVNVPEPVNVEYSTTIEQGQAYLFGCEILEATGSKSQTLGDSTVTVHLTVNVPEPVNVEYSTTIEQGQAYLFGCDILEATGSKSQTLGDSTVTVHLTVNVPEPVNVEYSTTIEQGQAYLFGCDILEATGSKSQTLGDSTVTVHLTVNVPEPVNVEYSTTIEQGQAYLFGCDILEATGSKSQTLGDSTVTVHLTVNVPEPVNVEYSTTIEQGQAYLFGCDILEATGSKSQTLGDSTVTVHLTVNVPEPVNVEYSTTIEQGQAYLFGCDILEATGSKSQTLGDSTVTVHLTVNVPEPVNVEYSTTIEQGQAYLFGCDILEATGSKSQTLGDSTVTVHLTVNEPVVNVQVQYDATITTDDNYLFHCEVLHFEDPGPHPITHTIPRVGAAGDSIITLNLTVTASGAPTKEDTIVAFTTTIETTQSYLIGCNIYSSADATVITDQVIIDRANVYGDSIINLTLNVVQAAKDTAVALTTTIEPGQNYLIGCKTYFSDVETTITDQVIIPRAVVPGDSIINLTLNFVQSCQPKTVVFDTTAYYCEADLPVMWHNIAISNDTTNCDDTIHVAPVGGCPFDSIVRLKAIVLRPTIYPEETQYVCDFNTPYNWHGKDYSSEGDFYDTVPSTTYNVKCADEIYTLHLRLYTVAEAPVTKASICKGAEYEWKDGDRVIGTYTEAGEYGDTLYYKAGCDSIRFKLVLNVQDVKAEFSEDIYLCFGEKYEWKDGDRVIGTFDQTGVYHDTLPYISGCDSVRFTLNLTVGPEPTSTTWSDTTIYYGYEFPWFGKKYVITKDTAFYNVERDEHECVSAEYYRSVKVKDVDVAHKNVVDTVCAGSRYAHRTGTIVIDADTTWTDSVRVFVDAVPTDSFYHYTVFTYTTPEMLPENLLDSVKAVCGELLHFEVADSIIRAYVKDDPDHQHFDPNVGIEWFVQKNGQWVAPKDFKLMGSDSTVTFKCVVTDKCEKTLEVTKTLVVEDPAIREIKGILVEKYGQWLLMLHVNNLKAPENENGYGYEFTEEDVDWYRVVNGVTEKLDHHGYYYTGSEELTGEFYAVINATSSSGCDAVVRSNTVNWSTPMNAPLRLIPNLGEEGTLMRLVNLNPNNDYQIYGYNEAGKLVQTQSVSGQATTEIRAEGNQGIYMLRVVTEDKVETLRYIIK